MKPSIQAIASGAPNLAAQPCGAVPRLCEKGASMMRNQRTVFYVDDNPKALRMLTSVLEGCGYKMVTACDSDRALDQMVR